MRVLGVDPGTINMGYGVLEAEPWPTASDYGVITVSSKLSVERRLFDIYSQLLNLISDIHPQFIAVEEPFVGRGQRQFIGPAIAVGQAQALVLIAAAGQGIPVFRYTPAQVKRSVADYGAASKLQIQQSVMATLELVELPESDAADALAVALCHLFQAQAAGALNRVIIPGKER